MLIDGHLLNPFEVARGVYRVGESAIDLGLFAGMTISLCLVEVSDNPITRFASNKLVKTCLPIDTMKGLGLIEEDEPGNVISICDAVSGSQPADGLQIDQLEPVRALG